MAMNVDTSRRNFLLGGLSLAAMGTTAWIRPSDMGGVHSPYFQRLSCATKPRKVMP